MVEVATLGTRNENPSRSGNEDERANDFYAALRYFSFLLPKSNIHICTEVQYNTLLCTYIEIFSSVRTP